MIRSFVRAMSAASFLAIAAGAFATASVSPAVAAEAKPKTTKAVIVALIAAQTAAQAKDFQTALTQVKAAQAVPDHTPYDDYQIDKMLTFVAINLKDYDTATAASERVADSPFVAQEANADKMPVFQNALILAAQKAQWDKVIAYGQQLEALGLTDPTIIAQIAIAYHEQKNDKAAMQYAQKSIDAAKAAGTTPPQAAMQLTLNSQAQTDQAGAEATLERMAVDYNSPDTWGNLVNLSLGTKGAKDLDLLYMFRLKFLAGGMQNDNDYESYADIAIRKYLYVEAQNVLEDGLAKGKVKSGQVTALLNAARNGARLDQASLGKSAAEAKAAKSGDADAKMAEDYFGYRRYADAEEAARRAISKGGVKESGEGQIVLAQALLAQGKGADEALQLLGQVTAPPARAKAAHLWSLYAQALQKKSAAAAAH